MNLVLNYEKCHFMVDEGIILGHIASAKGIEVDESNIDVITSLPYPTNYTIIMYVVTKDVSFDFDESCKEAFDKLKGALTMKLIMQPPN
ncbi:Retrovirus-related Pol polyprotein from transposon 17.6 [Gossypium australe]|uniref:Retrovirus-related Pol polyprotein from transposon 17.6 n=1 Tax=Gossypium australe TaxID=47621 RepID=A0A5B6WUX6_9ROSI|nr:Retrovirus-related Pol polyprotein from transposon 17.6 [Gossypium australe]